MCKNKTIFFVCFILAHFALESLIKNHIDQDPKLQQDKEYLESIPGIGPTISQYMLVFLNGHHFRHANQLAAYLGLVPTQHESGSSVRGRTSLSKVGNARFRSKLYMATISATRCNSIIMHFYQRLVSRGKTKKSALCAAMRKLAQQCYGVIKNQTAYAPNFS